ncbi:MAG: hypothetical protein AAFQ17_02095, partial [Pseudomonadota bacterium]
MSAHPIIPLLGKVVPFLARGTVCLLVSASVLVNTTLKPYADALDDAAADANTFAPGLMFDPSSNLGSYHAGTLTLGQGAGSVVIPDSSISIDEVFPGASHGGAADLEAIFGNPAALSSEGIAGAEALEDPAAAASPHGIAWDITSQTRNSVPTSIQASDPDFYADLLALNELSRLDETFEACETVSVPGTPVEDELSFEEERSCLRFDGPGGLATLEQTATVEGAPALPYEQVVLSGLSAEAYWVNVNLATGQWRQSWDEPCSGCEGPIEHDDSGAFSAPVCEWIEGRTPVVDRGSLQSMTVDCAAGIARARLSIHSQTGAEKAPESSCSMGPSQP